MGAEPTKRGATSLDKLSRSTIWGEGDSLSSWLGWVATPLLARVRKLYVLESVFSNITFEMYVSFCFLFSLGYCFVRMLDYPVDQAEEFLDR